jgi:hypothetical protein
MNFMIGLECLRSPKVGKVREGKKNNGKRKKENGKWKRGKGKGKMEEGKGKREKEKEVWEGKKRTARRFLTCSKASNQDISSAYRLFKHFREAGRPRRGQISVTGEAWKG